MTTRRPSRRSSSPPTRASSTTPSSRSATTAHGKRPARPPPPRSPSKASGSSTAPATTPSPSASATSKSKTPPKGTGRFLATAVSTDAHLIGTVSGNHLAADWLGSKEESVGRRDLSPAKSATDNRALVVALVAVLADYEADQTDRSWRDDGTRNATGRYLRFLAACGYGLSLVEKYAASNKTA